MDQNASDLDGPVTEDGSTLLHIAVKMANVDVAESLLEKKVSKNAKDENGNTALHLAYLYGYTPCCSMLINYGCSETIENRNGKHPNEMVFLK